MSTQTNNTNIGEGKAEEIGGKIKKVVGKVLGDQTMEAKGEAKETTGVARQEAAKTAERVEGKVQEVIGAVKNRIGQVLDSDVLAKQGKADELEGQDRQQKH